MAHHVTESHPTHHLSECGATRQFVDVCCVWYHMCGLPAGHAEVHACGECEAKWSDI